jgi:hypothetical protein
MSHWSWKAGLVVVAVAAGTVYAIAQMGPGMHGPMTGKSETMQRHHQMMQDHGMHGGMMHGQQGMHGPMMMGQAQEPTMPGQAAFGATQEVVQILEADPATDWSKVNIAPLREHLIDMNEVTLSAAANESPLDNGIEIAVTGEGRTLQAIKRMIPAHAHELSQIGWNAAVEEMPNGVKLTVTTADPKQVAKLKALGFMGIMVLGPHHQPHHLMMAKGEFNMR